MKDDRIIELIEAYGTNPEAWPDADREAGAAALAAPSDDVKAALAAYAPLDALFADMAPVEAPDHLIGAIVDKVPERPVEKQAQGSWLSAFLPKRLAGQLTAAAASLVLGLGIGLGTATAETEDLGSDAAIYSALGISSPALLFEEASE